MTDIPDTVMIFAAGFGTRMGALTRDCPKPLIEVAGKPLFDHALALVQDIAPRRIVANTHYRANRMEAHLAARGVIASPEPGEILDTGGGLKAALPLLGAGPVFTLNPDVVWRGPNPLRLLRAAWDPTRMDALLLCVAPDRARGRQGGGDFDVDDSGRARRGSDLIYGGAQILRTDGLADIADRVFSLNLLWDRMIGAGRLYLLEYPGTWCDVGRPEGIAMAEALLEGCDV